MNPAASRIEVRGLTKVFPMRSARGHRRGSRVLCRGRRRVRGPARPIGLRQEHDAEHGRRPAGADRWRHPHRRRADLAGPGQPQGGLRVPARHHLSLAHRRRQHPLWAGTARHTQAGSGRTRHPGAGPGRLDGFQPGVSGGAVRRHAPACLADAHADPGTGDPADGRTVRRAGHAYQDRDAPHPARHLGAAAAERAVRHPRPVGGADPGRPHHPALGPARPHQGGVRRRPAPSARRRHPAQFTRLRRGLHADLELASARNSQPGAPNERHATACLRCRDPGRHRRRRVLPLAVGMGSAPPLRRLGAGHPEPVLHLPPLDDPGALPRPRMLHPARMAASRSAC